MRLPSTSSRQLLRSVLITVLVLTLNSISLTLAQNETSVPTNEPTASRAIQPSQSPSEAAIVLNVTDSNTTTEPTTATTPSMAAVIAPATAATPMPPTVISSTADDIITSPSPSATSSEVRSNIVDIVRSDPNFSTLVELYDLLLAEGYEDILSESDQLTVMAPTNDAFDKLPPGSLDDLRSPDRSDELYSIISNHLIGDNFHSSIFADGSEIETLEGNTIKISYDDPSAPTINDGEAIIISDITATNGVINIIDSVLMPSKSRPRDKSIYNIIKDDSAYSTLGIVVDAAGLSSILSSPGNYTLFAPNNAALMKFDVDMFSKYLEAQWLFHLQDMLLYHALPSTVYVSDMVDGMELEAADGENLTISLDPLRINDDMAEIDMNATDMVGNNGVLHGINDVLLPSSARLTVVDRAVADPNLSVLVDLVQTAGLVGEFSALPGPVTLLAPTNSAFDKLPNGTIEELKLPKNIDMLSRVLKYHVIVDKIYHSSQFEDEELLTDVGPVTFSISDEAPMVNEAIIIGKDILGSNGIVHVVDTVLVPPEPEPTDPPSVMPTQVPTHPTLQPTVNVTTEPVDPPSSDAYVMKQRRLVGSVTVVVTMLHLLLQFVR